MATKERYQNPVVGDLLNLRMITYNSNNLANVQEVQKVEIFFLDEQEISAENPSGARLVEEFDGTAVVQEDTGQYLLQVDLSDPCYTIGKYFDVWTLNVIDTEPVQTQQFCFEIYADLWYATPTPVIYDFSFRFQPTMYRRGSIQWLIAEVIPNVPRGSDLQRYYENLAIAADLRITIKMRDCEGSCPVEEDLQLVVDNELMQFREKRHGFYKLNTEDMNCGIYDVWFQLDFGGNRYISERMQMQIYD